MDENNINLHNEQTILLLAFRNSQKKFFENMLQENTSNRFKIISTKSVILPGISGFHLLKEINLSTAYNFAIDEFYAKTEIKIPRVFLKFYFKILAYINFFRYYKILNKKYAKLLIWNGGKFRQRIAIEIAKKLQIDVYFYENGLLPNRLVLDKKGINYENDVPREKSFFENYTNNLSLPQNLVPRIGKNLDKFRDIKNSLPEKYIFVPFQVDYDTQIISHSHWIKNMRALFDLIVDISASVPYKFVLKEHPSSGKDYSDLHKKAELIDNIIFANGHSTQVLINNSFAVITINSTVGIESLLFHKKVIVLGDAFYSIENICQQATNHKELIDTINSLSTYQLNKSLVDNFLKYLYYDYLITKDKNMYQNFATILLKD